MLNRLICLILGYFIGAIIQTGFWIGRFNHIDIRDYGSGNAGTTNTMRTLGTVSYTHLTLPTNSRV